MTTSDSVAAVSFSNVVKRYGPIPAVNGLTFSLPHQGVVALLGPNGSGKSTTINMLLGLLRPDSGDIDIYGRPPADAVRAGQVGAMLQHGGYPNSAKVREILELARQLYRKAPTLAELSGLAGLDELLDRRVDRLSGGQVQRVRFAFALAGNPRLLVLDEPTVGMDIDARQHFWAGIRRYTKEDRMVLFSTHYLEEADAHADRIVVMAAGTVLMESSGAEIKKSVSSRTVSFVLGEAPFDDLAALPGVVSTERRGERAILRTTDSDATVNALLATCGPLKDLELTGGSLEDAFLALTGSTKENGAS